MDGHGHGHPGRGGQRGRGRGGGRGRGRGGGRGRGRGGDMVPPDPHVNGVAAENHHNRPQGMPLGRLENIAAEDGVIIMQKLSDPDVLAQYENLTRVDHMDLVVKLFAKLCAVDYQPLVVKLFTRLCRKEHLDRLSLHILGLGDNAAADAVADFYRDLCKVCHGIVKLIPTLACEKLEGMLWAAQQKLAALPHFDGREEVRKELEQLKGKVTLEKQRLAALASSNTGGTNRRNRRVNNNQHQFRFDDQAPPDDFRQIPTFPTVDDIVELQRPYLRRILRTGPYASVDHYLDVHFRLLREDFMRPLREALVEYCRRLAEMEMAPNGRNNRALWVRNIRVYEGVKFASLLSENDSIGLEILFDPEGKLADVNWEFSRRLIKGALLLLARDLSFTSIVLAMVSVRNVNKLAEGRVVVELCQGGITEDLFEGSFTMVECTVFFGSYYSTLQALQGYDEASFPLTEYIVGGSNAQVLPAYMQRATNPGLNLPTGNNANEVVRLENVEQLDEWPSPADLTLDPSQFGALQGALTSKVMLIQGPPGTGKTFLGLKVAKTLLLNQGLWTSAHDPRPILVVCSTNHALDQFLLGLLPATDRIVRVGNPCRNQPDLEPYDIFTLRKRKIQGAYAMFQMIRQFKERFSRVQTVHESVRSCYAQLRNNGSLMSPASLFAFGAITRRQMELLEQVSIVRWLLGEHGQPFQGGQYARTILDPTRLDLTCLEGVDIGDARDRVMCLEVSHQAVVERIAELEKEQNIRDATALGNVLEAIRDLLTAPETRPPPREDMPPQPEEEVDLLATRPEQRWQLYRSWKDEIVRIVGAVSEQIGARYLEAARDLQECSNMKDHAIMKGQSVVGISTSYAAFKHRIIRQLKPRIVIVEEAAEVLEANILVSLTADVEHLVMIGDHQQLRPQTAVRDLAKDYHLDVSLFERLVNNGVRCVTLNTQHRMRPEIARLICPHIYPNLLNHESVNSFPDIRGLLKNVFFVDHQHAEEKPKFLKDCDSFQNSHEAYFLSELVRHLLLQGYDASNITVLCTYKGQLYFLTKEVKPSVNHLKDVRITSVDDYQGEENDIVLLSLVRSNSHDNIGYVGIENRVCVALSRARHGFYLVGDMSTLTARDSVWRAIRGELESQTALGPSLPLHCAVHDVVTNVASAEEFHELSPQGGCLRRCDVRLGCGHLCPQVCHTQDPEHATYRCLEPCSKLACPKGHPCKSSCCEPCPPCMVPKKVVLLCGHEATMPCYRDPEQHKCQVKVMATLPACRHNQEAKCHKAATPEVLVCKEPCVLRMDCGHTCEQNCHVLRDPFHQEFKCMKPCEERRSGCSLDHRCRLLCHEACEECVVAVDKTLACGHPRRLMCKEQPLASLCTEKCERPLACGHVCKKKCREPCAPCMVKVDKFLLRCGHVQPVACYLDPGLFADCDAPCRRLLPRCGHACKLLCRQPCAQYRCVEPVPYKGVAPCGHRIQVPCSSDYAPTDPELQRLCREPCTVALGCEHKCAGSCGQCMQGRIHLACQSKCERTLICGHACEAPCAASCPPCGKDCAVKCRHSKCPKRCGERCALCKERCPRRCTHRHCPKLCGEPCPEEAICSEPCTKTVEACGHPCAGLCGDVCVCRHPDCNEVHDYLGVADEEGARMVILPDCKHVFEVTGLDRWLLQTETGGTIKKMECPQCKTPIANSPRYSNAFKQNAVDVASVKEKVFGSWDTIRPVVRETINLFGIVAVPAGHPVVSTLRTTLLGLLNRASTRADGDGPLRGARAAPALSLSEVQSVKQYVGILSNLCKTINEAHKVDGGQSTSWSLTDSNKEEIRRFVDNLCRELVLRDMCRLSAQEAADITLELLRFQRLSQLSKIESCPGFIESLKAVQPQGFFGDIIKTLLGGLHLSQPLKDKYRELSRVIRSAGPYSKAADERLKAWLEELAAATKVSISKEEIRMVTAAMGLQTGHWFKCPNGHYYCITECGGAMQEGTCNECGARIGGQNHRLRRDNALAGELDGARAPAWPTALN